MFEHLFIYLYSLKFQCVVFCAIFSITNAYNTEAKPHVLNNNSSFVLDVNATSHNDDESTPSNKDSLYRHEETTTANGNNVSAFLGSEADVLPPSTLPILTYGQLRATDGNYNRPKRSTIPLRPLFVYREIEERNRQEAEREKLIEPRNPQTHSNENDLYY